MTIDDAMTSGSGANNRKLAFAHRLVSDTSMDNVIDDGVTLYFRSRLTPASETANGVVKGYLPSAGKSMFTIRQAGTASDYSDGGTVGFSLVTTNEWSAGAGLIMNSQNGTTRSSSTNPGTGTTNLLSLDPTVWHDFWITINADTSGSGTHKVKIYLDGSLTPTLFDVTMNLPSDTPNHYGGIDYYSVSPGPPGLTYLMMSLPASGSTGAYDTDYFSWKAGAIDPVPEPCTLVLLALAGMVVVWCRLRKR